MPRLSTALPKYRKHRKSGQAVVTINGRDHYLGPHGTKASKLEYDRLIGQFVACGRDARFGLDPQDLGEITVAELINAYRKWAVKHYRHPDGSQTGTAYNMRPIMKNLRLWYGDQPVSKFRPLAFKDVIRRQIDAGLSISTVNDQISRIKHMFRWGVSEELVSAETLRSLESVSSEHEGRSDAKPRKIVEAVPDAIVEATLPRLPEAVRSMVKLQRYTGMRPAEVCMLRPCDIVESDGVLLYAPSRHKTQHHGKSRDVVIAGKARAALEPYLQCDPSEYCFSPRKTVELQLHQRSQSRVTPINQGSKPKKTRTIKAGSHYTSCSYRRAIHRACKSLFKNGYKWSPNQLRHACAEDVQDVADIEAVAAVLGHTKVDTSRKYAKRNIKLAIETMKTLNADNTSGVS